MSYSPFSRREFLKSTAALSFMFLPGVGRVKAMPFHIEDPDDYTGRLSHNENPLGPSPLAQKALAKESILANRYPDSYNSALEAALGNMHELPTNHFCAGAGATEMIRLLADAFLGAGDEILTATPTYTQMAWEGTTNGAAAVYVPVDKNYVIDLQGILDAVTPKTKLISLVNPNNPLGKIIHKDEMASFLAKVPKGVVVAVDEAYHHYVQTEDYESCIHYVEEGLPVIVIRTLSKAYGLAGARTGYTIASPDLTPRIGSSQLWSTISRPSQAAAIAALDDTSHVEETINLNIQAKEMLYSGFTDMKLEYIQAEANFVMVDVGTDASAVRTALGELGFQIRSGWGMPKHLRVSTGTLDEMAGFLEALASVLEMGIPGSSPIAHTFALQSIYPNPFNSRCTVRFNVMGDEKVTLVIYDLLGRKIRTLVQDFLPAGEQTVVWDGKDTFGVPAASGVYAVNLLQGEFAASKRIQLIK